MDILISTFSSGAFAVVRALLFLILAFIVASIARSLIKKLLLRIGLDRKFGGASAAAGEADDGKHADVISYIGNLVYLFVFLLFVPGILSTLGMTEMTSPIVNMLNSIWGYIPNILAAAIILVAGFFVARLVRQLLVPIFDKIHIDALQEKAGIEVSQKGKLSETLAYIVYVVILIPVIISALTALNIAAISGPAINMLNTLFAFIPNIFVAIILIWIGLMIGKFAGQIIERLIAASGLDGKLDNLLPGEGFFAGYSFSKVISTIVTVIIDILFVVQSFSVLKLGVLENVGAAVIAYLPYAISALLIMGVAMFLATLAQKALKDSPYAKVANIVIIAIGAFMSLNQLGIAPSIVNSAFVLIVAALAVAFAIAFGIGGKDFAAKFLEKYTKK